MKSSNEQVTEVLQKLVERQPQPPQFSTVWDVFEQTEETNFFGMKRVTMVLCVAFVLMFATGFGYYQLFWANQEIVISSSQDDLSALITPLETFDDLKSIQGDVISSEDALLVAPWLHIQEEVVGWQKIDSYGSYLTGELDYFELYLNEASEKIVVMQSFDEAMTTSLNHQDSEQLTEIFRQGFPHDSLILDEFGTDLAVLMDLQAGRYSIVVYKEHESNVYRIDVWGNSSADVIEFAKLYYQN